MERIALAGRTSLVRPVLLAFALILAFGVGWITTLGNGYIFLLGLGGLLAIGLFLRFPASTFVVMYPLMWIFWAYTIPGIGRPERIIGALGILAVLMVLAHERAQISGLPTMVVGGLALILGAYLASATIHPDLTQAPENMIALTTRLTFLYLACSLLRSRNELQWAVRLFIVASLFAATLTFGLSLVYGFGFTRDPLLNVEAGGSIGSLLFGGASSAGMGTAAAVLLLGVYPTVNKRSLKTTILVLASFLFAMAFAAQFRREALFTIPLAFLFFVIDKAAGLRRVTFWLLIAFILVFVFVVLPNSPLLQYRLNETNQVLEGTDIRTSSLLAGLNTFLQSPLLGYGPGAFRQAVSPYLGMGLRSSGSSPYNVFIWIAVEAGILGLMGVGLILLGILREAIKFRDRASGVEGWVLRCAPAIILLIVIWFTFGNAWELSLPWFLMGLILAAARLAKESTGSVATA